MKRCRLWPGMVVRVALLLLVALALLPAAVKAFPLAIVLSLAFVAFSRLLHFSPGFIYGFVGAYALLGAGAGLGKRESALVVLWGILGLLGAALLSFSLRGFLHGDSFWLAVLSTTLAAVFVGGLEGLVFGLLPITFLDGGTLASWKKWVWLVTFALVFFVFYHFLVNRTGVLSEAIASVGVRSTLVLIGAFVAGSFLFWLYFRLRRGQAARAPAAPQP